MQATGRMSAVQYCTLAALLSCIVFVLTKNAQFACTKASFLGERLQPAPAKLHVLVTGGAGYIGSHAAKRLLQDGHSVTVVDNLSRGNRGAVHVLERLATADQFQFVEADLGQPDLLMQIFRRCQFDAVMHFAAVAYVAESVAEPVRYYKNITSNVVNVLQAMKANNVNKLVFSSTCATYGNPPTLPVTEATPTTPVNPYGAAKLMAEDIIRDAAASQATLKAVIFRYFNVYGSDPAGLLGEFPPPALRRHSRISGACMDAALGLIDSMTITGTQHPTRDGTCVRDYIHVADLVDAHVLGMAHLANPPALYNIGTGKGTTVREMVDACRKVTGRDILVHEQAAARPGDYSEIWADPSKIERELGWKARYLDVEQSLRHAWIWRRQNPHGYAVKQRLRRQGHR